MFKVEFYCDDNKVGQALWRLVGIAIGKPDATPVINAKKANGKLKQVTDSGNITDLYLDHVRKHRVTMLSRAAIEEFLKDSGAGNPSSAGYVLKNLKRARLIRMARGPKTGYAVKYNVLPAAYKAGA